MQTQTKGGICNRLILVLTTTFLLLASTLPAQERFGELQGTVTDSTGAAVPGATVTVTNKGTNRVFTTKSGADGSYILRDLEPGRYMVKIEAAGFSGVEYPDV